MNQKIRGELKRESVIVPREAGEELENRNFGRHVAEGIKLTLVESAYLLYKEKIEILDEGERLGFETFFGRASAMDENFTRRYIVYRDLRERGYHIQPSPTDFRIYPRGGQSGTAQSKYLLHIISERERTPIKKLLKCVETAENLKKELILAIVDEESDITFYKLKKSDPKEKKETGKIKDVKRPVLPNGVNATLLRDRTIIWNPKISEELHNQGFYGKMLDKHLQLSLVETAYLLKNETITLHQENTDKKPLTQTEFTELAERIEPDFKLKYQSYEDLRKRKLTPKTGFKFGAHFRTYTEPTTNIDRTTHSTYLIHAIPSTHTFQLSDFSRAARLAHSVRKHIIYAIVKNDNTITYLEIIRKKM